MNNNAASIAAIQKRSYPKLQVVFMGFTVQTQDIADQLVTKLREEIRESISKILPAFDLQQADNWDWDILNPDLIEITINPAWSVKQAWDCTYKLRRIDKVIYAQPRFALQLPAGTKSSPEADSPVERTREAEMPNSEWHLEQMNIKKAWDLIKTKKGIKPGEGVVIAHPDTGFLRHPELDTESQPFLHGNWQGSNKYLEKKSIVPEADIIDYAKQNTDRAFPVSAWHGTATASLMVSPEGSQQNSSLNKNFVTGVAPGATLKPYHLGPTTLKDFEFFVPGLAKAINDAAKDDSVRVISISFGGYPALSLRRAIINAGRKGIIVVASAGNSVPFSLWPSTYANVIAVASSNYPGTGIAQHSAQSSRIDVAAPGEQVMVAIPTLDKNENLAFTVEPRSGTSYAAPLVAGIAALWISYHGWDTLLDKYQTPARIPLVFDMLLRQTCKKPAGWDEVRCGEGIVDAEALLLEPLPSPDDPYIQESLAYRETDHIQLDNGGAETFVHLFEHVLSDPAFLEGISTRIYEELKNSNESPLAREIKSDIFQWVMSKLFKDVGKKLRQYLHTFGQEIMFYLATDPDLYQTMETALWCAANPSHGDFEEHMSDLVTKSRQCASEYWNTYLGDGGFNLGLPGETPEAEQNGD